jgi:hypothetical protein
MQLKQISEKAKTLLEFYDPQGKWGSQWGNMPKMMQDLVRHLEAVDHSPVWAFTSHHELLLTDTKDSRTWLVTILVKKLAGSTAEQLYRVTYALDAPWWHATGYANGVEDTARLVLEGLDRASRGKRRNILFNSAITG